MDISSPQILLMIVIMGGLIAYLGDWLGRKMGKKRLRIWGMRPRHTATFFTVAVGMLIPIATTYAIATISAPVRTWLTEGTQVVRERDTLLAQREQLNIEVGSRRSENAKLKSQNVGLEQKKADAERQFVQSDKKRESAERRLSEANRRETQIQRRVTQLSSREALLRKSVQEKSATLADKIKELGAKSLQITSMQRQISGLMQDTISLARQAEEESQKAGLARKQKIDAENQRDEVNKSLQQTYDKLREVREALSKLQTQMQGLTAGIDAVRNSEVLFRKGEELSRLQVDAGVDSKGALEGIMQLVKAANLAAKERGVKPDKNGQAAAIDERRRLLPDGSYLTITVKDQVDAFVNEMTHSKEDVVLIASSYYNYFSGEQRFVPLELNMFLNRIVYKQNEEIASTTIDGSKSEEEIVNAVLEFLTTKVRNSAEQAGMIPIHGQGGSLGEISFEEMSQLVRKIRSYGTSATLTATAAKQTKSAEPLRLKFKVQPH